MEVKSTKDRVIVIDGTNQCEFEYFDADNIRKIQNIFVTWDKLSNMSSMFATFNNLKRLDISGFTFDNITNYTNMFANVPDDCEIVVKSQTEKEWIESKFANLTNVIVAGQTGHIHQFEDKYEAHDEDEVCVITRWQECSDSNCPDGEGTHFNETTTREEHQYVPVSEYEIASGRWVVTDECTVCKHTRTRHTRASELGTGE